MPNFQMAAERNCFAALSGSNGLIKHSLPHSKPANVEIRGNSSIRQWIAELP
jgi:hypothetical protein